MNVTTHEVFEAITPKIYSIIILPTASLIAGLLPIILSKHFYQKTGLNQATSFDKVISFFLYFGGGVLLCTIFLHLLPEITETVNDLQEKHVMPTFTLSFPELVLCLGFFMIFFIEEIMHSYLHSSPNSSEVVLSTSSRDNSVSVMEKSDTGPNLKNLDGYQIKVIKNYQSVTDSNYEAMQHSSANHNHSHLPLNPSQSLFYGLLTVLALSVHELFEGLAVGLEPDEAMVWYLLAAIACHKTVLAGFIGIQLVVTQVKRKVAYMYIIAFALTSPTGIAIGLYMSLTSPTNDTVAVISVTLQAMATGTLLYVAFFEVYGKQFGTYQLPGIVKVIASLTGFIFMSILQTVLSP